MKTFHKLSVGALLALSLAGAARAAEPVATLTIEALQRIGLEVNGQVRAALAQVRAAEAGTTSAAAYPNPELDVLGGQDRARAAGVAAGVTGVVVAFEQGAVSPSRLSAVDTVYAMTVHKAQGSEFDSVAVVLPRPT